MKQISLFIVISVIMSLLTMSCEKKEPIAEPIPISNALLTDFTAKNTSKASPGCGALDAGLVTFTNLSRNYSTLTWNFGDGSPLSADKSPNVTHQYAGKGPYQVTLRCVGDSAVQVKTTTVSSRAEGCINFYSSDDAALYPLTVTCNGATATIGDNDFSCTDCCRNPSLYSTRIASFKLPSGTYNYAVKNRSNTTIRSGSVTVTMGDCNTRDI
jgi:PKD repeat protein